MKISISKICGYLLIYIMLVCNQSNVGELYIEPKGMFFLSILLLIVFLHYKNRIVKWGAFCVGVLILFAVLVRFSVGGIGVGILVSLAIDIFICVLVIIYNGKFFYERFVNVVTFLATISILAWLFCMFFPQIWESIIPQTNSLMSYKVYSSAYVYEEFSYKLYGLFLYTHRNVDSRNVSIFTEPGIYQMVLNSALFVILFCRDKFLNYDDKKIKRSFIVILIAIATTQSTTGYISLFAIIIMYFSCRHKEEHYKWMTRYMYFTVVLVVIGILLDYSLRKDESLLYVSIIGKLFTESKGFSLAATKSGAARTGVILLAVQSLIAHPFGVGYDRVYKMMNLVGGLAGAGIAQFAMAWGVIPLLFILWWVFYPIAKSNMDIREKAVYIFMYLNTVLAQTDVLYPTLIVIPLMLLYSKRVDLLKNKKSLGEER